MPAPSREWRKGLPSEPRLCEVRVAWTGGGRTVYVPMPRFTGRGAETLPGSPPRELLARSPDVFGYPVATPLTWQVEWRPIPRHEWVPGDEGVPADA